MNVLLNVTPLITALWAWFLLAERLTWVEGAGMLVAVTGIGLVQQRRK
jgi:drug/metabolite transporter (DMT)-like permease